MKTLQCVVVCMFLFPTYTFCHDHGHKQKYRHEKVVIVEPCERRYVRHQKVVIVRQVEPEVVVVHERPRSGFSFFFNFPVK